MIIGLFPKQNETKHNKTIQLFFKNTFSDLLYYY